MIHRRLTQEVESALDRQPAVAILGPRQVGKTTLALAIAARRDSVCLDLETAADRGPLEEPGTLFEHHRDRLVVLDEVQHAPELFGEIRAAIDRGRREGRRTGRFLLLGSASAPLLRQSESLAGRLAPLELGPFEVLEVAAAGERDREARQRLWLRGGLPESFLARDDASSLDWRNDFLSLLLARDIPRAGPLSGSLSGPRSGPALAEEKMRRLWTMLAHGQGGLWNGARIAAGLGLDTRTVNWRLGLLVDLLLVRRLAPYAANLGKRLVKAPKIYVRDSGLLHALLGIRDLPGLLGHPVVGASWEGFVIETLVGAAPKGTVASFYRTANGAECDLVLELPGRTRPWAVEAKRGAPPGLTRGFHSARADLRAERAFVVYPGDTRYPMSPGVEAIGLPELAALLREADLRRETDSSPAPAAGPAGRPDRPLLPPSR